MISPPLFKGCMDCQDRERERGILSHILVPRPVRCRLPLSVEMFLVDSESLWHGDSYINTDESWGINQELFISFLMQII